MIEDYAHQNLIVLRTYGVNESCSLGSKLFRIINKPLLQLMLEFKFVTFNRKQDVRRLDWPVGLHLVVPSEVEPRRFRSANIHFSGKRFIGDWVVTAGRFVDTRPQRRIRILTYGDDTFMIVIVHESRENYGGVRGRLSRLEEVD